MKNFGRLALVTTVVAFAGCASDHSLQPFHTSIQYDPSGSHTFLSEVPPANAPSTRDWKTNQLVGVGYGTSGPETAAPNGTATAAGAASSPSGTSSGAVGGISSGGTATPARAPSSTVNPSTGVTSPGSGLNTTPFGPGLLTSPSLSGIGVTNTGSGVLFTNTVTGQTNFLPGTGLNRRGP